MDTTSLNNGIDEALAMLHGLNPNISGSRKSDNSAQTGMRRHRLQKVVVANRGEIAKRFFLALHEEGIPSVAVVTDPDRGQSWYEFADEVIFIGDQDHYASIAVIIAVTLFVKANAIYSGYGFLSENMDFVLAVESMAELRGHEIIFMGPSHGTISMVGDKMNARGLARRHDIPLFESSDVIRNGDIETAAREAARIGYPVMVKPCSGGGGKGICRAANESELSAAAASAARIGLNLYRDPSFYLERYIRKPVHIEVQIFNGWAIGIRKCAVQRRNQKIIEESGHAFLSDYVALSLLAAAEKIAELSGYSSGGGAGTVEFLIDTETGKFGFMEMNTRLQVEYAVTDQSLGIDIAKWQILFFDGREHEIVGLEKLKNRVSENDHSIECRIYAEEPENDYLPSPGPIIELDLPTFNGIRCDFGFMEGDTILPMYDPMIGKLIAHGATRKEAMIRLERALQELYINGVKTNIPQLLRIVRHPAFIQGDYTNNLLTEHAELNFSGAAAEPDLHDDRRFMNHVVFGAFTEHLRMLQHAVKEFIVIAALGNIAEVPSASDTPSRYTLEYRGRRYALEFIQTAIDCFYAFVNGAYNGEIVLTSMNDRCDDILLIFGSRSYRVRVNRHGGLIDLRMKDESNKINYYRIRVIPEGYSDDPSIRRITSPFQGSFVSFCRNLGVGDMVEADEQLLILSSMKMETVITSPVQGRLIYLIEDGDSSKLQVARTPGGRIIGRSIQEGELLAAVEIEPGEGAYAGGSAHNEGAGTGVFRPSSIIDNLLDSTGRESRETRFTSAIELIYAAVQGYIYQPPIIDSLEELLKKFSSDLDSSQLTDKTLDLMNAIIIHYTNIKKLFSPVVSNEGLSFQEELGLYIAGREENLNAATRPFEQLLKTLFESYGISRWEGRSEMSQMTRQYVFVLFKRAYQFCLERTDAIKAIVHIISGVRRPGRNMFMTLAKLMEHEQAERDDSLLKFIKRVLSSQSPEPGMGSYHQMDMDLPQALKGLHDYLHDRFRDISAGPCAESLAAPADEAALTADLPESIRPYVEARMVLLEKNFRIKRLFSPVKTVAIFLLETPGAQSGRSYIAYSSADYEHYAGQGDAIESAFTEAAQVIQLYQQIEKCDTAWAEIMVRGRTLTWTGNDNTISYQDFKGLCTSSINIIRDGASIRGIITMDMQMPCSEEVRSRSIVFYRNNDSLMFDLLIPSNRNNPYHVKEELNAPDQRLFDIDKWPIEVWAGECFDRGSVREIRIPSIDDMSEGPSRELQIINRPVGAKIFQGTIGGAPACFYMKDSRVSGGSTGSREGLKYIAAAYISYLNDWPLYVWNDSAGANIMEGVISLNRGAEGFMMNTLLTQRSGAKAFANYVENTADADLVKLFHELDKEFRLDRSSLDRPHRSFQLTAVGIGSSAGLDVYGSSQASIQILLDSKESYRVLTGSKVVHTVIGEEITNYDIGGAKILGTWTGIVDIVACDKLHLARCIGVVQHVFCSLSRLPAIARKGMEPPLSDKTSGSIVFNESDIRANVDDGVFWPFKENYYAAEALIGGFARLGGRRVLIMGPRTHSGLRSLASIIKARELLKTAYRTGSHQVIILGRKWHQAPDIHENIQMRPRMDFMNTLQKKSGLKIHIITHPEGLKCFDINSAADAIICIKNPSSPPSDAVFTEKNAAFLVGSLAEAFDLVHRLISLIDPLNELVPFTAPAAEPSIPEDPSEPYDIIGSVIDHVFDPGTFIEFYRDMNNPVTGPNLITGLAGLEGRTVGIIADQPLIKGGGADAIGTEKFRVFTEFLNFHRIPLMMLSNSSGFVPGSQQERHRIQAIGAESLDTNILGTIPVVSVVLNQNYGGRLIHAFNKFLRPGIVYLALEKAIMAVIGVDAAFDLLFGKKYNRLMDKGETERAEDLRKSFLATYLDRARASVDGLESNLVDWTIPSVKVLRSHLVRGLELAIKRCAEAFGKKEG
ncbi:MAG TPA: carboxyl transferase domain-containing protein [Spirochaetota bacterium]|nr:carboxyl transferase domain-containing protein [Spirochaetota bacterium]HPV39782.1 carboxyl transferase domain-containing protein [Spirochaetota bacterium]